MMTQSPALWGAAFAALIYVMGNGLWINRLVRRRLWLGWLLWSVSCVVVLVVGAAIENHFGTGSSIGDRLSSVDMENHWISLSLYALISVPGAACVILRQSMRWTQVALFSIALVLFIPAGLHLEGEGGSLYVGLGLAFAVCAILWVWQVTFDTEPSVVRAS
ncbi:MAG: hypothetical protein Q9M13_05810 [Mariprofundales bacterium]|nr:hypothetical protein [Mariprofundales bacterium]